MQLRPVCCTLFIIKAKEKMSLAEPTSRIRDNSIVEESPWEDVAKGWMVYVE
jgi:hypothetical protein